MLVIKNVRMQVAQHLIARIPYVTLLRTNEHLHLCNPHYTVTLLLAIYSLSRTELRCHGNGRPCAGVQHRAEKLTQKWCEQSR